MPPSSRLHRTAVVLLKGYYCLLALGLGFASLWSLGVQAFFFAKAAAMGGGGGAALSSFISLNPSWLVLFLASVILGLGAAGVLGLLAYGTLKEKGWALVVGIYGNAAVAGALFLLHLVYGDSRSLSSFAMLLGWFIVPAILFWFTREAFSVEGGLDPRRWVTLYASVLIGSAFVNLLFVGAQKNLKRPALPALPSGPGAAFQAP